MSSGPIWTREEPGRRRASLTREQIAETAIRLVDEEGVEALSMRRIAQALGVGTMTLYHYVATKQELLELVDDVLMGELIVPEDEFVSDEWRTAITQIAERSRDMQRRHPWLATAMGSLGDRLGPNGLRHFDQSLAAFSQTRLPRNEILDLISFVDEYVFGFGLNAVRDEQHTEDGTFDVLMAYVEEQLGTGLYPNIERLFPTHDRRAETWAEFEALQRDEARFRRGLDRLLDGVALDLERRGLG